MQMTAVGKFHRGMEVGETGLACLFHLDSIHIDSSQYGRLTIDREIVFPVG